MKDEELALKLLSSSKENVDFFLRLLESDLSLPNIPLKTQGGHYFWTDIAEFNGWRLQQNMVSKHARILDANDVRIAWGTVNGMKRVMNRLIESVKLEKEVTQSQSNERINAMTELTQLKQLLDIGAITQDEYNEKKKKLMSKI